MLGFLDYFALFLLFFVFITLFYGIIVIHDIPYEISKKRNHPHQDAIHVAGWVSLFTLHVLWPFLWIWATLFREDRGWGFSGDVKNPPVSKEDELSALQIQIDTVGQELSQLKSILKQPEQEHSETQLVNDKSQEEKV